MAQSLRSSKADLQSENNEHPHKFPVLTESYTSKIRSFSRMFLEKKAKKMYQKTMRSSQDPDSLIISQFLEPAET